MTRKLKELLREPLVHFLLIGTLLFVAYELLSKPDHQRASGTVVVTAGQIEAIRAVYERTQQRPATQEEVRGLGNWIQTVPGKGWNMLLRLYSPTETFFTKTWRPSEIEQVN